jgi:5-methyltetrahydrofolate--homocysteine methyltransferase
LISSVVKGDISRAAELAQEAQKAQVPAREILERGLVPAMDIVGDQFARSEIFFPELLMAGDAMKEALELLKPELSSGEHAYLGKCVIGTVRGDVHDIGKNIVIMMLEGNGFEVTDLGIDVPPERFCEAVASGTYDIVGMGAYVSLSLPDMEATIEALQEAGLRNKVKIMVGGVPVTREYAEQIGADAYGETAVDAVSRARNLVNR